MKLWIVFFLLFSNVVKAQTISTFAGTGSGPFGGDDGPATSAGIMNPAGGVFDKYGNYYFADNLNSKRVRKISPAGIITTIAGGGTGGFAEGVPATSTVLFAPSAVTLDTFGNIYIADAATNNNRIRKVNITTGIITTIAGIGTGGLSGDGGPATAAMIKNPNDICFDKFGNMYIADMFNFRVRKITPTGIISTFAGNGGTGPIGDGGPATNAVINGVQGVAVDDTGNVYFGDVSLNRVRKVNLAGIINTVAGNGTYPYIGDGIPATDAQINPIKIAIDKFGQLFIADEANGRVFKVDNAGVIHHIAGNGMVGPSTGDGGAATAATLDYPSGVAIDICGNVYIPEAGNHRIRKVTFYDHCFPANTENITTTNTINIYPNPTNDELKIDGIVSSSAYRLLSITGVVLQEGILKESSNNISIQSLPAGMYMVEVYDLSSGFRMIKKIVKQ